MDTNIQTIVTAAQNTLTAAASAEQEIEGLTAQVTSLQQQLELLQGEVESDAGTIQTLKDQLAQAQAQLAALANVAVFDGLEQTPWLLAPGTSANSGQTGNTAVATQDQPNANCAFFNLAPNGSWADAYWYKKLGADTKKSRYKYEISFLMATAADAAASNCVELDIQQVIGGVVYNTGLQFDFGDNALRVWDRSKATPANTGAGNWVATGQACPRWSAGQWQRVVFETHRDAATVYVDAITINGKRTPMTISFAAPALGFTDELNCAVQLDGNKAGTAYRVYVDAVRFTAS